MPSRVTTRDGGIRLGLWRFTRAEVSGGLADLGVLVPLELALIAVNGLNPTSTLLGVGIAYILAGLYFRIPMPVQPLKAFAVIAVAEHLSPSVIAAGALLMAGILGLLAATGLVNLLARLVPMAIVRGVQAGLGLLLAREALTIFLQRPFFIGGERKFLEIGGLAVPGGLLVGIGGLALLLLAMRWRHVPASAALLLSGAALGIGFGALAAFKGMTFGPAPIHVTLPEGQDFLVALPLLVVPQMTLTLTNSVIATVDAAKEYFGAQAERVTPRRVSFSIAFANVWAGLLGGLPACHGCGGLTAHYRLGARTPAATAFLGVLLIAIALLFGNAAIPIRTVIPYAVLGVLLLYVGWQHLQLGLKIPRSHLPLVSLVAIVSLLPGSNLAWGAGLGLAVWWSLRLANALTGGRLAQVFRFSSPADEAAERALDAKG